MQQRILRRAGYTPKVSALIGGQPVGLTQYDIDRELPDPYASSPSYSSASGTLVGLAGAAVTTTVPTPWDSNSQWPPVGETAIAVTMDIGQGPVDSMVRGKVLGSDGDSSSREVNVEFSDRYQSLDQTISWNNVKAAQPAHDSYGWDWTKMRYVGMLSSAITDMIFRHCGWYATPPRIGYTSLSVPAMGTMWPEAGTSLESGRAERGYPYWATAPWGVGVTDFVGKYGLAGAYSIKSRGRMEMAVMAGAVTEYSRISVATASNAGLFRLQWTATQAQLYLRAPDGAYRQAAVIARNSGELIYATVEYVNDTLVRCTIRSGTRSSTPVDFAVAAIATTEVGTQADFVIQGTSGAFQIAYPSTAGGLVGWTPNAVIRPRTGNRNNLFVLPSVAGENCLTLLKDQALAEAGTFWIDERGILQWWDLTRLEGQTPVETLTSATDITDKGFGWEHSDAAIKSKVSVKWQEPMSQWHPEYTITLDQGTAETLQSGGEVVEDWINVPDDEIWIQPDVSLQRVGTADMQLFNQGIGSWYGGIVPGRTADEPDQWAHLFGSLLMTITRVNDRAFKTWVQWTGSREVVQKTPDFGVSSALWRVRYNMDLPIFRGKAKIKMTDRVTYSTQQGPETAPEQELDLGWWIQSESQAQFVADYVASRVTIPQPVLTSIDVAPMPGLELGDVIEVNENRVLRAAIRGILVEDNRSVSVTDTEMKFDQQLRIRPTYIRANGVLWQEWSSFIRPRAWQAWAATQAGEQWTEWGQAPLT